MSSELKLAQLLITERKKRGMTVKAFSQFLGVPASTLFSWETGVPPKNIYKLKELASRLNIVLASLL